MHYVMANEGIYPIAAIKRTLNSYNKCISSSKKIGYDYFARNKPKPKELHNETLLTFE